MKSTMTLTDMAAELERQNTVKRDFVADTRKMEFGVTETPITQNDGSMAMSHNVALRGLPIGDAPLRKTAHDQFATTLGIPRPYYQRMLADAPDLLVTNLNRWMEQEPKQRMVRTLDGEVRALLSDRYRPLDNFDLAMAVLPKLQETEAAVVSINLTEDHLYLQATSERIRGDVQVGDTVQAGVTIRNSEVGLGTLSFEEMMWRLICSNGMVHGIATRQRHVGRSHGDWSGDIGEFLRDETRRLDDAAFWNKVVDATAAMFSQARFDTRVEQYRQATTDEIVKPIEIVEVASKRFELSDDEQSRALSNLVNGGSMSRWGLANAVTALAHDIDDPARALEVEKFGAQIIELGQPEWRKMAEAAAKN